MFNLASLRLLRVVLSVTIIIFFYITGANEFYLNMQFTKLKNPSPTSSNRLEFLLLADATSERVSNLALPSVIEIFVSTPIFTLIPVGVPCYPRK